MDAVFSELINNPLMSLRAACALHGVDYRAALRRSAAPELEPRYLSVKRIQQMRASSRLVGEADALGVAEFTPRVKSAFAKRQHASENVRPRRLDPRPPVDPRMQRLREARRRAATAERRAKKATR
jgi:hypothetical protein